MMCEDTEDYQYFQDKEQNNLIINALYEQKKSYINCDVVMKVCGKDIQAHSNVLAAASPYFNAFLSQDLPRQFSQRNPQVIEIQIDGSEPNMFYEEAVSNVIDFIYTGRLKIASSNVSQINEIAKIMQMTSIVRFCEMFLKGTKLSQTDHCLVTADAGTNTDVTVLKAKPQDLFSALTNKPEHCHKNTSKCIPYYDLANKLVSSPRFCYNKLISVSCQVTPRLLGLETDPIQTRDEKTQTINSNISKVYSKIHPVSIRKRGRPRKSEAEHEDQQLEDDFLTNTNDENLTSREPGHESCDTEINQLNTDENNCSVRRSKRTPKPSHKIQDVVKLYKISDIIGDNHSKENVQMICPFTSNPNQSSAECPETILVSPTDDIDRIVTSKDNDSLDTGDAAAVGLIQNNIVNDMSIDNENENSLPCKNEPEDIYMTDSGDDAMYKESQELGNINSDLQCAARIKSQIMYCEKCNFKSKLVRQMANHKKLHRLEQNICFYCDREFANRQLVTEHMEQHKGPLPFYCHICESRFKNQTQLKMHLPKHFDNKPFSCDLCNARFKWKHALKGHMLVHSNIKRHLCDICGYATRHKCQLKAHRLIHTGQTYKCDRVGCTFQATKTQNLKYHMLTHTREKPHQCEVCGQAFSLIKNLHRHMLLHSATRHLCSQCDFTTTRIDKLKEHQLKQHAIGTPPEKRIRVSDQVNVIGTFHNDINNPQMINIQMNDSLLNTSVIGNSQLMHNTHAIQVLDNQHASRIQLEDHSSLAPIIDGINAATMEPTHVKPDSGAVPVSGIVSMDPSVTSMIPISTTLLEQFPVSVAAQLLSAHNLLDTTENGGLKIVHAGRTIFIAQNSRQQETYVPIQEFTNHITAGTSVTNIGFEKMLQLQHGITHDYNATVNQVIGLTQPGNDVNKDNHIAEWDHVTDSKEIGIDQRINDKCDHGNPVTEHDNTSV